MDIIDINAAANKAIDELSKSGQVGSATKPVYTYDGDPSKVIEVAGYSLVKVSDVVHDLNAVVGVKGHHEGAEVVLSPSDWFLNEDGGKDAIITRNVNGDTLLICLTVTEEFAALMGAEGGTYFHVVPEIDYYTTYVEFAETVKPIDPKYLEPAMPTVLDLTQFECVLDSTTVTYNDALVQLFNKSVMANGALQIMNVDDAGRKLSAAATGKGNVFLRVTMPLAVIDFPSMVAFDEELGATQLAFVGLVNVPGIGILELKAYMQLNESSTEMGVLVNLLGT